MALYKLYRGADIKGNKYSKDTAVFKNNGGDSCLYIPFDPDNTDYQEYLEWVEAGNTPEAAD